MITLRLDPELENNVNNVARLLGISKSELVRRSVSDYLTKIKKNNPWEAGKGLFGRYASGQSDLSQNKKKIMKNKILAAKK